MAVLPIGIGSAVAGGFNVERSLRFNSADSAYLNRTPATTTNRRTWTWSAWVKRGALGSAIYPYLITAYDSSGARETYFNIEGDCLRFAVDNTSSGNIYLIQTTQVFRDPSAWYHIMVVLDTTQATTSNRLKMYVNGTQITAFSTANYPAQNYDATINLNVIHNIGRSARAAAYYYDGYLTEVNFIDGQALTPSSFGETDSNTGVWKPKAYSGTYGTNGFYLKFADNSGTTSTTLGKDSSGNGNNWTPNNFSVTAGAGNDSLVDSPTSYGTDSGLGSEVRGNYCTLNPLSTSSLITASNGNLNASSNQTASTGYRINSTFAQSSGKWYFEVTNTSGASTLMLGVGQGQITNQYPGQDANSWGYHTSGLLYNNSSTTSTTSASSVNDVIGVAFDIDAGKIWFSVNGTFVGSGNPSAGTNPAFTGLSGSLTQMVRPYGTTNADVNFGQRAFAYTAPSGFKALCTQNFTTPTIGATSTTQAGKYFNPVLYSGNSSTQAITGVGFQPDFVWCKARSTAAHHIVTDAVRTAAKVLSTSQTAAESAWADNAFFQSLNSDGFTLTGGGTGINTTGNTYVAWNWKANGAGSSNTAGTITSTVSANTTSGFSIVTYTGNGTNGATVGHGLGIAPSLIVIKNRGAVASWLVYSASIGASNFLVLNTTDASAASALPFNNTAPTSSVFSLGTSGGTNTNGGTFVAYCFAPVAGYSAFGSYTGNGSADGVFVYTGFRPKWVMLKSATQAYKWYMLDAARNTYNVMNGRLFANASTEEVTTADILDFTSNGFKIRTTDAEANGNGQTIIYACFAESPFKYALAR